MSLRLARAEDEPFVKDLWLRCLHEEYDDLDAQTLAAEWSVRFRHEPRRLWIAEAPLASATPEPVGFAWFLSLPDPTFRAGNWWLYYVATEPAARGRGVAAELLTAARAELPGTIRLLVRCASPVRSLYQRLGASPFREEWHWPAASPPRAG